MSIDLLYKRPSLESANSRTRQKICQFVSGVALVTHKIVRKKPQTAQRVVPPVMKVHYRSSIAGKDAPDALKQFRLVPRTTDERVQTCQVIDAISKWRPKIVRMNKNNVLEIACLRLCAGIRQGVYRQIAMKNRLVFLGGSKCAAPGPCGEITKDGKRVKGLLAKKLKHFTRLALAQPQPSPRKDFGRAPCLGVGSNRRWPEEFAVVTLSIERQSVSFGKRNRPRRKKLQDICGQQRKKTATLLASEPAGAHGDGRAVIGATKKRGDFIQTKPHKNITPSL
ncbi:MAG: hypothetical protein WA857_02585 [Candidatus Acidiferrum sp.]